MKEEKKDNLMEKVVSLCKRRGFVFQGSEIYGGLAGTWDFGHFGVALVNNIKQSWWKKFVDSRRDMYGIDAAILMNSKVWEASGHVAGFSDPIVECLNCHSRFRTDSFISDKNFYLNFILELGKRVVQPQLQHSELQVGSFAETVKFINESKEKGGNLISINQEEFNKIAATVQAKLRISSDQVKAFKEASEYRGFFTQLYLNHHVFCPNCGKRNWEEPKQFNMMFKTSIGAVDDGISVSYLRPETAQGMFVNFKNTVDAFHPKLPFGMAQIGKAFRNEIAPRDFLFRQREFEQMEIEYFVRSEDWEKYFEYWKGEMLDWMEEIGLDMSKVHELEVPDAERAHYSKRTIDFEFDFPFGRKELFGLVYRSDFDLKIHKLEYIDEEEGEKITPHVIEPSFGVDRALLALLLSAYKEDPEGKQASDGAGEKEKRVYFKFKPNIAPVICAISPLLKNKPELVEYANTKVYAPLKAEFGRVAWDDNGNIGKRYRRQDEIGTPFCIVVDFDTLTDDTVTVRDRDTGEQERVKVADLKDYIKEKIQ